MLEEGNIVLCTVEKIEGTLVFVKIDETGQEGTMVFSEVAPGRIRNIRNYVVPKKKIVCKILRKKGNQFHLSLRRVSQKEEKEEKEHYKLERSYKNILKSILREKAEKIISEIQKNNSIYNFFQEAKENPEELEKLVGKENSKKILEIIAQQKKKQRVIKKIFILKSDRPDGIIKIKEILEDIKDAEIKYISSGKYSIKTSSENIKDADKLIKNILENIEKQVKKYGMEFAIQEK